MSVGNAGPMLDPIVWPKNGPKIAKQIFKKMVAFFDCVFEDFEDFGVL